MIKRFLKRAVSTLLCTTMIISSGLNNVAYADGEINANITGGIFNIPQGSAGDAVFTEDAMAYFWDNPSNCGIRITIIDRQGNAVTNSVDILEYNLFNLLLTMAGGNFNVNELAVAAEGTGTSEGSHVSIGEGAHKNTSVTNSEVRGFIETLVSKDAQGRMKGVDIELDDGGYEKVYNNCIIMTGHKFDDTVIDSNYGGVTDRFTGGNGIGKYERMTTSYKYISGKYNDNKITTFNAFRNYLDTIADVSEADKQTVREGLKNVMPSLSGSGFILNKMLNLGGENGKQGEIAKVIMNWKDGDTYLFEYNDASLKKQVSDKKPPIEVARDNKFKVIIEPVVWCVPYIITTTPTTIFKERTVKTKHIVEKFGNQLFGYVSPYLVYGSVTQVCIGLVQDMILFENTGSIAYNNIPSLKSIDNMMTMGASDLLQTCLTTYITSKDDPEITYNGMQLYSPSQHSDVFPLYNGDNSYITIRGAITGGSTETSMDFWRIVGYGCGIIDIEELFRPSTGTSTPGTPAGPTDPTKYSKLVKIYLDKDGDGYEQSGYYEEDKWYNETVSVVDETHEDGKEYKVYTWKVSKEDKNLSTYEDGTKLIEELGKLKTGNTGRLYEYHIKRMILRQMS